MEEKSSIAYSSYIQSTADNYQSRFKNFEAWANEQKNSEVAKHCRDVFLHFLSLNVSRHFLKGNYDVTKDYEIRLIDAGCGSGRDLKEFASSHITVSIPPETTLQSGTLCSTSIVCYNSSCSICDKKFINLKEASAFTTRNIAINAIGFDVCPGFVEKCQRMGLNAELSDFITFFHNIEYKKKHLHTGLHGIFALASLFHLPKQELATTLRLFHMHLLPEIGVLLTTIPKGSRDEIGSDGRWKLHIPKSEQTAILEKAGFKVVFQEQISLYNGSDWILTISVAL